MIKKFLPTVVFVVMITAGAGFLFYPNIATWWNSRIHSGLIQDFEEQVSALSDEEIEYHLQRAREYNDAIGGMQIEDPFVPGSGAIIPPAFYMETLNIGGIMAQIEIPRINVLLPVFHTTNTDVLDRGVGHIEGTSLPIGGTGTHSVLTGHTGLAHHTMFNGLIRLTYGDRFFVRVLNQTLAYEVDQILTVYPHEIESLQIAQDADYITLVTCTPYAVNTFRLLVRGARIPYEPGMEFEIFSLDLSTNWRLVIIATFILLMMLAHEINKFRIARRVRRAQKGQADK